MLGEQLAKLGKLRDESIIRKVADFEHEKACIAEVLENIDEARIQFEVRLSPHLRGVILSSMVVGHRYEDVQDHI